MVEVKFTGTPEEVQDEAARFFRFPKTETVTISQWSAESPKELPKKETKEKKAKAEPVQELVLTPVQVKPEPPAEVKTPPQQVTSSHEDVMAQIKGLIPKLLKEKGEKMYQPLLKKYGVERASLLKPDQSAQFLVDATALLVQ